MCTVRQIDLIVISIIRAGNTVDSYHCGHPQVEI